MAIYTCTTQEGTLAAEQRAGIAREITRIHSTHTGEPAGFVWVIFETVSPDRIYEGGKPAVMAAMGATGFRGNRGTEVKPQWLKGLWSRNQNAPGLPDAQTWVRFTETLATTP